MNSGMVDRNWAKEHHNLWVEEEDQKASPKVSWLFYRWNSKMTLNT
jgi:cytochrome b subunit of formate dehydrogenase